METTKDQTPTRSSRQVLAAVLAVIATLAVGVHELAPGAIVAIRTSLGLAAPVAVVSEAQAARAAPSAEEAIAEEEEALGPAKQRPLIVEARDTRVKPNRAVRR